MASLVFKNLKNLPKEQKLQNALLIRDVPCSDPLKIYKNSNFSLKIEMLVTVLNGLKIFAAVDFVVWCSYIIMRVGIWSRARVGMG